MKSNFEFLEDEKDWEVLYKMGKTAEILIYDDPNTSLIKIRQMGEFIAKSALVLEKIPEPSRCDQLTRINMLKSESLINREVENIFHAIRKDGNDANHEFVGETKKAKLLLSFAFRLAGWFKELYGSDYKFDISELKYREPDNIKIYENLDEAFEMTINSAVPVKNLETTIEQRKEKATNIKMNLSEKETRFLIDEKLSQAGWIVNTEKYDYKRKKLCRKEIKT